MTTRSRNSWTPESSVLDIADSPRCHWYGPDSTLFLLAKTYHDPLAQWLALDMQKAGVTGNGSAWLNFVYRDPSIQPVPPDERIPPYRYFEDMGIVVTRTSWSGDESLLAFKCGPYIGHKAMMLASPHHDLGGGHVHPDANHFTLFGAGEMLLSDDGYANKLTANHNTLLVDGKGQMGEGQPWFQFAQPQAVHANPHFQKVSFDRQMDYLVGDATEAYPKSAALKSFKRHVIFVKPEALIVIDEIETTEPKNLELRFFTESQIAHPSAKKSYVFTGSNALLRFTPLDQQGDGIKVEPVNRLLRGGAFNERMAIRIITAGRKKWRNVTAFCWSRRETQPQEVALLENGETLKIKIGGKTLMVTPGKTEALCHEKVQVP